MLFRSFLDNQYGMSLMHDVILFIIMVSLSGVILLPLSQRTIVVDTSLDKHREDVVDNALHTFLVSRPDLFRYRFCGVLIDDVAEAIGIDTSSEGFYESITAWVLAHEQRHKTYATLIAENLGCQFQLPFSFFNMNRLNMFTTDFDRQLQNETKRFFSSYFDEKYQYNLTAWWHPIKGICFGGSFSVGEGPPTKDCYVAQQHIMMPYTPIFSYTNHTVVLTKHWLRHHLFTNYSMFRRSSIPSIANITCVIENYTNRQPPYNQRETTFKALQENISVLVYGFLINGITNETDELIFPGILHIAIMCGFEKIKNLTSQFFNTTLEELFGGMFQTLDHIFGNLNTSAKNPLSNVLLAQLNSTLRGVINDSSCSLSENFNAYEELIKKYVTTLIESTMEDLIESFINGIFDCVDTLIDFSEMIVDWLFDRISLNSAEAVLTIWVVRE
ncbi:MAG: hypothetical protein JW840_10045 [Candidatus Thermoplasmatota archaeon]|nr:hypothetical protein [Candidatus Thermoplasmatota archaeon]